MAFKYKIDVLSELKAKGFSTYKLRDDKIFGQSTINNFRTGKPVSVDVLDRLCVMLDKDIGDILTHEQEAAQEK